MPVASPASPTSSPWCCPASSRAVAPRESTAAAAAAAAAERPDAMPMTNPDEAPQRLSRRHRRAPMAAINVTPFVDVMLVLLIVFMVTAPLLTVGVTVDLPAATSSPLPGQDEPLSVSVRADGQVYLQNSPLSVAELGPRLRAITERKP